MRYLISNLKWRKQRSCLERGRGISCWKVLEAEKQEEQKKLKERITLGADLTTRMGVLEALHPLLDFSTWEGGW